MSYGMGMNGGYGTGGWYGYGFHAGASFRTISYAVTASNFPRRPYYPENYWRTYKGIGWYEQQNAGTAFPETFRQPGINRSAQEATASITWKYKNKVTLSLQGKYELADDTLAFSVEQQVFTGSGFRTLRSRHAGEMKTEKKSAKLELKYPWFADSPVIKFNSRYEEETKDLRLLNFYHDTLSGYPWGFAAVSENRDVSNMVTLENAIQMDRLWLPWIGYGKYGGVKFRRKPIRLKLSHTWKMERGISDFTTRTDLFPQNGTSIPGSDLLYFTNHLRPSNNFSGLLTLWHFIDLKKPEIDIDFYLAASYIEQPWTQNATRVDGTGAFADDALEIRSTLITRLLAPTLATSFNENKGRFVLKGQYCDLTVRDDESGAELSKHRFAVLPSLQMWLGKTELTYSTAVLSPTTTWLVPNPDLRNPSYIRRGNADLGFGKGQELTVQRGFYGAKPYKQDTAVERVRTLRVKFTAGFKKNPAVWITQPDSAGILYAMPVNLPYMASTGEELGGSIGLFPGINLSASLEHSWLRYDYRLSDTLRTMKRHAIKAELASGYKWKGLELKTGGNYALHLPDFTGERQFTRSYHSFNANVSLGVKLKKQVYARVMTSAVRYVGPGEMPDKSLVLTGVYLEWFRPGRYVPFSLRLTVNDLFNHNQLFTRGDSQGLVQQVSGIAPGRYVLLTASFSFSKSLTKKS